MDKVPVHVKRTFLSKLLIVQICCLYVIGITAKTYANNVPTFTVSAPVNIEVNTQFRLVFAVASTKELDEADLIGFSVSMPKELKVLLGPTRSKVSQIRPNGSTYQVSYTYILSAPQTGTFSISAASITFKGKMLHSEPVDACRASCRTIFARTAFATRTRSFCFHDCLRVFSLCKRSCCVGIQAVHHSPSG